MGLQQAAQSFLARRLLKLPESWLLRLSGGTPLTIRGRVLDPHIQFIAALAARQEPLSGMPLHQLRTVASETMAMLEGPMRPLDTLDQRTIPGPEMEIPVRIYRPVGAADANNPGFVYFHQGGCVIGNPDWCETFCSMLADTAKAIVMSVDYRLAPEHKFPAAHDDAVAAYEWMVAHADELGIDPGRIGVGGDSAGGNLSAGVSLAMKIKDGQMPAFQLLIYPWTTVAEQFASHDEFGETFPLNTQLIEIFTENYVPEGTDLNDWRLSPLSAPDHSGLPPALIATAGFDPISDEGEHYAKKLEAAGVPVTYRCYEHLSHSFTAMSGTVPAAKAALEQLAEETRQALQG